jgi:hypothetical protein
MWGIDNVRFLWTSNPSIGWSYPKTGKLLLCRTVLSSMNSIQKQIVKSAIDKYPNLLESMPK